MDVLDPNILQRVFLEAILQVGIKKSIGDLGPECPFNLPERLSSSGRRRLLLLLAFDFTGSFQVHLVPDRVLVVRRRTPSFTFFFLHICYMLCWSIPLVS